MKCENILVPTDFSPDADDAMKYATWLAQQFHASLILLHVVHMYLPGSAEVSFPAYMAKVRAEASADLTRNPGLVEEAKVPASIVVEEGVPHEKIIEVARQREADLIVMGTHGRTGLAQMLLGSVAERVARFAPCPVTVVRMEQV